MVNGDTLKWPIYLQRAVYAINLTRHTTTKMPPLLIFHAAYAATLDLIQQGPTADVVRDELERIGLALEERFATITTEEDVPKDLVWPPDATFKLPNDTLRQGLELNMGSYESLHLAATVGTHVNRCLSSANI